MYALQVRSLATLISILSMMSSWDAPLIVKPYLNDSILVGLKNVASTKKLANEMPSGSERCAHSGTKQDKSPLARCADMAVGIDAGVGAGVVEVVGCGVTVGIGTGVGAGVVEVVGCGVTVGIGMAVGAGVVVAVGCGVTVGVGTAVGAGVDVEIETLIGVGPDATGCVAVGA